MFNVHPAQDLQLQTASLLIRPANKPSSVFGSHIFFVPKWEQNDGLFAGAGSWQNFGATWRSPVVVQPWLIPQAPVVYEHRREALLAVRSRSPAAPKPAANHCWQGCGAILRLGEQVSCDHISLYQPAGKTTALVFSPVYRAYRELRQVGEVCWMQRLGKTGIVLQLQPDS